MSDESMVERVGLAAYNAAENGFRAFDREKEDIQDYLRAKIAFIGRAAIQAMREPTAEMRQAGMHEHAVTADPEDMDQVSDAYTAMIDAALK